MLIVFLALWLVAISLVLRFLSVTSEARCTACAAELELWPESRRCPDCGQVASEPAERRPARAWLPAERDPIHALVAAIVQGRRQAERARRPAAPAHYQRASSGSTRSANSRTLS